MNTLPADLSTLVYDRLDPYETILLGFEIKLDDMNTKWNLYHHNNWSLHIVMERGGNTDISVNVDIRRKSRDSIRKYLIEHIVSILRNYSDRHFRSSISILQYCNKLVSRSYENKVSNLTESEFINILQEHLQLEDEDYYFRFSGIKFIISRNPNYIISKLRDINQYNLRAR